MRNYLHAYTGRREHSGHDRIREPSYSTVLRPSVDSSLARNALLQIHSTTKKSGFAEELWSYYRVRSIGVGGGTVRVTAVIIMIVLSLLLSVIIITITIILLLLSTTIIFY